MKKEKSLELSLVIVSDGSLRVLDAHLSPFAARAASLTQYTSYRNTRQDTHVTTPLNYLNKDVLVLTATLALKNAPVFFYHLLKVLTDRRLMLALSNMTPSFYEIPVRFDQSASPLLSHNPVHISGNEALVISLLPPRP